MKLTNHNKGFITVLAAVVTVVVTGGTILAGAAVIDNVHKQGCGSALNAWQKGDIYADLADADNSEALDQALKCKESINDAVKTAKPVASLMSASSNLGVDEQALATLAVDQMMSHTEKVSDPEYKYPVVDQELPEPIQEAVEQLEKKEMEEAVAEESEGEVEPTSIETIEDLEEEEEIEVTENEPISTPEPEEPEEVIEEVVPTPEPEPEPEPAAKARTHTATFNRPDSRTYSEQGATVTVSETTSGTISITFHENGDATCNKQMNFSFTNNYPGGQTLTGSGSTQSTSCTGDLQDGTFILNGASTGSVTTGGETMTADGEFLVTGYIDENGKIRGNISIEGNPDIPFQE